MRIVALLALVVWPIAVHADVESADPHPVARRSTWLGVAGHAGKLGALDDAGVAPTIEFALGRGRWQYFAEFGLGYAALGPSVDRVQGIHGRAGIGLRWLARSYTVVGNGGIELNLEAFSGMNRYWWLDDRRDLRPDLGFGVGWQMRFFESGTTFRSTVRVYFAPDPRDADDAALCRGTCNEPAAVSSGLQVLMGFAW